MGVPINSVYVTGQGQVSGDQLNTFCQLCTTAAVLRQFVGKSNMVVFLLGIQAQDDGLGGVFYWNAAATGPDDNLNTIVPTGVIVGAWVRDNILTTGARTLLTSTLVLYVSTTGNDTNNGLSPATAFLTIQRALVVATEQYDLGGQQVIVSVAAGTYSAGALMTNPLTGGSNLTFSGQGSCNITTGSGADCFRSFGIGTGFSINGFTLSANGAGACCAHALDNSNIFIGAGVVFGTTDTAHMAAGNSAGVFALSNYSIAGGAQAHWLAAGSAVVSTNNLTIAISGSPAFTQFAYSVNNATVSATNDTFTNGNTVTGLQVTALANGVVNSAGALNLPGTGTNISSGGQYV